jgi:hypothetical protein
MKEKKYRREENRLTTLMAVAKLSTLVLTQSGSRTTGNLIHPAEGIDRFREG